MVDGTRSILPVGIFRANDRSALETAARWNGSKEPRLGKLTFADMAVIGIAAHSRMKAETLRIGAQDLIEFGAPGHRACRRKPLARQGTVRRDGPLPTLSLAR